MGFLRRVYTHEDRDFTALAGTGGVVGAKGVRFSAASGIKPTVIQGAIGHTRDGTGTITARGVKAFGFAEYDAAAGDEVNIVKGGIVRVQAGAAITAGSGVRVDANGDVVAVSANNDEIDLRVGRAWTGGALGDEIIVDLDD